MNERSAHEKEINRLQQEINLVKEINTNESESNILPVSENKLKQSNSSNHIHDDDEMVSII